MQKQKFIIEVMTEHELGKVKWSASAVNVDTLERMGENLSYSRLEAIGGAVEDAISFYNGTVVGFSYIN